MGVYISDVRSVRLITSPSSKGAHGHGTAALIMTKSCLRFLLNPQLFVLHFFKGSLQARIGLADSGLTVSKFLSPQFTFISEIIL